MKSPLLRLGDSAIDASHQDATGQLLGAKGSLCAMFRRTFGAGSPAMLWNHWTPIFGYYLGRWRGLLGSAVGRSSHHHLIYLTAGLLLAIVGSRLFGFL